MNVIVSPSNGLVVALALAVFVAPVGFGGGPAGAADPRLTLKPDDNARPGQRIRVTGGATSPR